MSEYRFHMRAIELRTNASACEQLRVSRFLPSSQPDEMRAGLSQARCANWRGARFVLKVHTPTMETRTATREIQSPLNICAQVRQEAVQGQLHVLGHRYVVLQPAIGALATLLVVGWEARLPSFFCPCRHHYRNTLALLHTIKAAHLSARNN